MTQTDKKQTAEQILKEIRRKSRRTFWQRKSSRLFFGWSALLLSMTFLCDSAPLTVNRYYCFYWMMAGLSGSVLLLTLLRRFQFRVTVSDVLVWMFVCYGLVQSLWLDSRAVTKLGILALFGVAYYCFRWILSFRKRALLFLCVSCVRCSVLQLVCSGVFYLSALTVLSMHWECCCLERVCIIKRNPRRTDGCWCGRSWVLRMGSAVWRFQLE